MPSLAGITGTPLLWDIHVVNVMIHFQGVIKRDEFVFKMCKENNIPIVMLTSGGYLPKSAKVIADSIMNLHEKGLIAGDNCQRSVRNNIGP